MTDIQCEENGDCFLVPSKGNAPSDLIDFTDETSAEVNQKVKPKLTRPSPTNNKKAIRKAIKGRGRPKRVSPKKVAKRKGRKIVVKTKAKKPKRKTRR